MCAVTHSCKQMRRCYVCDMVHLIHVYPASLLYMTWLIHTKSCVDVICVTRLSQIRTHASSLCVRRGSIHSYKPCVAAPYDAIHAYGYTNRVAAICVTRLIEMNTLQHTASHCNTLQHTATHCNTLQHKYCDSLRWARVSPLYMWCNSIMRDMTHSNMWHDSFVFTSGHSGCCHMPLPEELWGALDYRITIIRISDVVSWSHSMRRFVIGTKTLVQFLQP